MHSSNKVGRHQQQRFQKYVEKSDSYTLFNQLTSDDLFEQVECLLPEHRERKYPPTETLSMFLAQALNADRSCQKAVNDSAIKRSLGGLSSISTATGGYCKARKRLPIEMISELAIFSGKQISAQTPEQWLWEGRPVRLVDGTSLTMPDTPANQHAFPQQGSQKEGLGFPICRVVGVVCLSSGAVLNAAIDRFNGKGSDEQSLLRRILDTFSSGDIVLGDAFFGTYFLLSYLIRTNIDAVFEQMGVRKRVTDFRKGKSLGARDHIVELSKPKIKPGWMTQEQYDQEPETIKIRELKAGERILITTLLDAEKSSIKRLYKQRWSIEVDFRNLKTTLGMDVLSCRTPEMVVKEIWVYLLAYNLIRLLMAQSALLYDLIPRELSFKHTVQLWLSYRQQNISSDMEGLAILFFMVAQKQVGNRPGRIEPRLLKRRPKPFGFMVVARAEMREKIRRNGHSKKLK